MVSDHGSRAQPSRISGFGHRGSMADVPGYEHVVVAWPGRMNLYSGIVDRPGPVFSALQVGVHACAQSATVGVLAALSSDEITGLAAAGVLWKEQPSQT